MTATQPGVTAQLQAYPGAQVLGQQLARKLKAHAPNMLLHRLTAGLLDSQLVVRVDLPLSGCYAKPDCGVGEQSIEAPKPDFCLQSRHAFVKSQLPGAAGSYTFATKDEQELRDPLKLHGTTTSVLMYCKSFHSKS